MPTRRQWMEQSVLSLGALALLGGCASGPVAQALPPVVFVHGNGDTAALWIATLWRFESNGWPTSRLHAIELPYPLARDDDRKPQPGRSSTAEHMAFLKAEVQKVLQTTGARQVVLVGNSRGGNAIRNFIQNGGGDALVSHAILGGGTNHGVQAIQGFNEGSEFSGTGPFLTTLNAPKNAAGDEVTGPVRWLTLRSDNNDKYAQPDGLWIGRPGQPTFVTFEGPALKGAVNQVLPRVDHREVAFSPAAFEAMLAFITGRTSAQGIQAQVSPVLNGVVKGLGLDPANPASGNYVNNLPLVGAQVEVYATDAATGARLGAAVHRKTAGADGLWGPFTGQAGVPYEFVISAPGYAVTHIYRSPFARTSALVHLQAQRLAEADKAAGAVVTLTRPRGYFDPNRDTMRFDGKPLAGLPPQGAGVSSSKIVLPSQATQGLRGIRGEFNGEVITGQTWPVAGNHVTLLELTY